MKTLFTKPIIIQLHPSMLLLGLLMAVATISSLVLLALPIVLSIKLPFLVIIALSSAYFIARDALLVLPWSWETVEVSNKGILTLVNKRQQSFKPHLATSSFVHGSCVILNLENKWLKTALPPVLIFNNVNKADEFRRLRVWLRVRKNKRVKEMHAPLNQLTTTQART